MPVSYVPVSYVPVSYVPVSYVPVSYVPVSYVPVSYLSESYRSWHSLSGRIQPSPQVLRVDRAKAKRWLGAHGRSTVDASRGAAIALFFTKKSSLNQRYGGNP
jgi:hypothetical protein